MIDKIRRSQYSLNIHVNRTKCPEHREHSAALPLPADLEVLHQASAGDFAAVDLLHVDVLRTEEPRHQNLQVVQEIAINLWKERTAGEFARRASSLSYVRCTA